MIVPTISEQLTQLTQDRNNLVTNLTAKGITGLTGNETFTELAPEVLNISTGITPSGTFDIYANGTYDITNYANAYVNVQPTGTINITSNGTVNVSNYASANVAVVDIEATEKDINFYDCDGFRVASWTLSELNSKTSLPTINRKHEGLVFEEWNWTLAQLKTNNNLANVGALYKTDDNKTRLYMNITAKNTAISITLVVSKGAQIKVEWGDGSTSTASGGVLSQANKTVSHTYTNVGNYVIKISMPSYSSGDYIGFYGNVPDSGNKSNIFGEVTSDNYYIFNCLYKVELSGQFLQKLNRSAFNNCTNLREFIVSTKSDDPGIYCFNYCRSLRHITLSQDGTKTPDYCFYYCTSLLRVCLPYTLGTIGMNTFQNCYSLESAPLPDKSTITEMQTGFYMSCYALHKVVIPKGVTTIGVSTLRQFYSMGTLTFPASVTSIGASACNGNYGLREIHFKSSTPPSVGSSAFGLLPTSCKIYVPSGKLSAYTSASNYPSSSTYTYIQE